MTQRLCDATLPASSVSVRLPAYSRSATRIGIAHIGPGAFHRAHQAYFIDDYLAQDPAWAISAIALKSLPDALEQQDGLYTLEIRDERPEVRIIGAIRELLFAPRQLDETLRRLSDPQTRLVTLTITEKGYHLGAEGKLEVDPEVAADLRGGVPHTVYGLLAVALRKRLSEGIELPVLMSCDNLQSNGQKLKTALVAFAREIDSDLAARIEDRAICPNTMVDSITPAADGALLARVRNAIGLEDVCAVQRERFSQWVIERHAGKGPHWEQVGADVVTDVRPFEEAKLRMLNGLHSSLAYLGLHFGKHTVAEALRAPMLREFAARFLAEDVPATLSGGPLDLSAYAATILARFSSTAIEHRLEQIAWDGSKKLPVRLVPTLAALLDQGRPIDRPAMAFGAWMHFVRAKARGGAPLVDPMAERLMGLGRAANGTPDDVRAFLALREVFLDLGDRPAFVSAVTSAYQALEQLRG